MSEEEDAKSSYSVSCHCGAVRGTFRCSSKHVTAWECNCSDCFMRGNIHLVVPKAEFRQDDDNSNTTLYLWGTKTAVRRFCKTCGILPWYIARSNPDGIAVTLRCVDWGDGDKPEVTIESFDGRNWEKSIATSAIVGESKS